MSQQNEPLNQTIESLDILQITEERKQVLKPLIEFVQMKINSKEPIRLQFICTHNSRRSHLSQVWAQAMASFYRIPHLFSYSSGTEVTAVFPMVLEVLRAAGFETETLSEGENPIYAIKFSHAEPPIIGFSKTFDDPFNPTSQFAAIMTCNSANEACPYIPGAEIRIPIMYEDPKIFDQTPQQFEKYQERSLQIATEMKYVFSSIKS